MGQGTKFLARFGREAQDPLSSAPLGEVSPSQATAGCAIRRALSSLEDDDKVNFIPNLKT
ncbi:MAG: hypothetical protein IJB34_00750 [Clostridia bacterium]|nr:hypothetical protein [Clostridia bacterium]